MIKEIKMSVEKYSKLEIYKGITKRTNEIKNIFGELKFNKKKPKYNYWSGFVAGVLVRDLQFLKPLLESKEKFDSESTNIIFESVIDSAKSLVTTYNWNMYDLNQLANQFFGDN